MPSWSPFDLPNKDKCPSLHAVLMEMNTRFIEGLDYSTEEGVGQQISYALFTEIVALPDVFLKQIDATEHFTEKEMKGMKQIMVPNPARPFVRPYQMVVFAMNILSELANAEIHILAKKRESIFKQLQDECKWAEWFSKAADPSEKMPAPSQGVAPNTFWLVNYTAAKVQLLETENRGLKERLATLEAIILGAKT
jgi:hypothetical protein